MFTEKDLSLYSESSAFKKTVSEIILPFLKEISVKENPLLEIDSALSSSESDLYGINNKTGLDTYKQRVRSTIFQACYALLDYRKSLKKNSEEFHLLDNLLIQVNKFLQESGITELKGNFYALYNEAMEWLPADNMGGNPSKAIHALVSVYLMLKVLEIKMGGLSWLLPRDIPEKLDCLQNKLKNKYRKFLQFQKKLAAIAEQQKEREAGFEAQFQGAVNRALDKLEQRVKKGQYSVGIEEKNSRACECLEAILSQDKSGNMKAFWAKYNSHEKFTELLNALSLSAFEQGVWFRSFYAIHGKGISWAWHLLEKKCSSTQLNRDKLVNALNQEKQRSLHERAIQNVQNLQQAKVKLGEIRLWIKNLPKVPAISITTKSQNVFPVHSNQAITSQLISGFSQSRAEMLAALNQLESQELALKLWLFELDKLQSILSLKLFRQLDMSEFAALRTALLKDMHRNVLRVGFDEWINAQTALAALQAYHQPLIESLHHKVLELEQRAKSMNEYACKQVIQSFSDYVNSNTGLIEQVARFFSPTYRQCIETIERELEKYQQDQCASSQDCYKRINAQLKIATADAWSWSLGGQKLQSLLVLSSRVRLFPLELDGREEEAEAAIEDDVRPASGWLFTLPWMS